MRVSSILFGRSLPQRLGEILAIGTMVVTDRVSPINDMCGLLAYEQAASLMDPSLISASTRIEECLVPGERWKPRWIERDQSLCGLSAMAAHLPTSPPRLP